MKRIAVLALQGAFIEHEKMLSKLGVSTFEIRQNSDLLKSFDGLILPGGESTTMNKLLIDLNIYKPLKNYIKNNMPVFGTCAGLILLAKRVEGGIPSLSTLNITALRNAYGRQLGSFHTINTFAGQKIPMTFIRAPFIQSADENVEILSVVDNHIVAAKQNNQLVTAFHPELDNDLTVHKYFLEMCS